MADTAAMGIMAATERTAVVMAVTAAMAARMADITEATIPKIQLAKVAFQTARSAII